MSQFNFEEVHKRITKWQPFLNRICATEGLEAVWAVNTEYYDEPTPCITVQYMEMEFSIYPEHSDVVIHDFEHEVTMDPPITPQMRWEEIAPRLAGAVEDVINGVKAVDLSDEDWARTLILDLDTPQMETLLRAIHRIASTDWILEVLEFEGVDKEDVVASVGSVNRVLNRIRSKCQEAERELSAFL
jgi:hypothetical protein